MKLRVLNGSEYGLKTGMEYQLSDAPFSIGRETENDLVISDASVSRKHCIFRKEGDSWIVEDNHSMNGFSINDKKIDGASEIFNGDIIKVHDVLLQVVDEKKQEAPKQIIIPPKPQVKITPDASLASASAPIVADEEESSGKAGIIFKSVLLAVILGGCVWMLIQILAKKNDKGGGVQQAQTVEQAEPPAAGEKENVGGNASTLLSEEDLKELKAEPQQPVTQKNGNAGEWMSQQKDEARGNIRASRRQQDDAEAPALILVESEPAGAEILIDKVACGKTPAVIRDAETGRHTLELSLPGYEKLVTQIDVPDEPPEKPYKLTLKQGIVSVVTEPAGAWVWEGRQFKGVTPLLIENMMEGSHELLIYGPGCDVHKETVEITPAKGEELNITLKSALGGLEVITRPADCNIYLNGVLLGKTKEREDNPVYSEQLVIPNIMAGNYVLKIEHPSGAYVNGNITVPKHSNCVQRAMLWVPTHKLKLLDGSVIIGMLLEKNEQGDIVMELPTRRPERYLKPQIDSLDVMDAEEAKEVVEKYSKANRSGAGSSARADSNVLTAEDLAGKAESISSQSFNQIYQNRQLTITGKPSMMMKEGGLYTVMFGMKVKCVFSQGTPQSDYDAMSDAKGEGNSITIRGVCSGKANDVVTLKNCILVAD